MMDLNRLYEILAVTTIQLRKGEPVETKEHGSLTVTEIFDMPHVDAAPSDIEKIDLEFLVVGVNKVMAEKCKAELISILNNYPHPERLAGGPSFIEVGAVIGDQGAAFQLFALGKVLGLWNIITPTLLGFEGDRARELAGLGAIMITGYRKEQQANDTDQTI